MEALFSRVDQQNRRINEIILIVMARIHVKPQIIKKMAELCGRRVKSVIEIEPMSTKDARYTPYGVK